MASRAHGGIDGDRVQVTETAVRRPRAVGDRHRTGLGAVARDARRRSRVVADAPHAVGGGEEKVAGGVDGEIVGGLQGSVPPGQPTKTTDTRPLVASMRRTRPASAKSRSPFGADTSGPASPRHAPSAGTPSASHGIRVLRRDIRRLMGGKRTFLR